MPTTWRSYRDHRFCDVTSPYIFTLQFLSEVCTVVGTAIVVRKTFTCMKLIRFVGHVCARWSVRATRQETEQTHSQRERGIGVFFTAGVRWDDDDSVDTQFKQEATAAADGDVSITWRVTSTGTVCFCIWTPRRIVHIVRTIMTWPKWTLPLLVSLYYRYCRFPLEVKNAIIALIAIIIINIHFPSII